MLMWGWMFVTTWWACVCMCIAFSMCVCTYAHYSSSMCFVKIHTHSLFGIYIDFVHMCLYGLDSWFRMWIGWTLQGRVNIINTMMNGSDSESESFEIITYCCCLMWCRHVLMHVHVPWQACTHEFCASNRAYLFARTSHAFGISFE